ncbi:MAG: transaldolase [Myxococcaceae bacterium]|nr:transaldolase [Myxococcaceae bacterium]
MKIKLFADGAEVAPMIELSRDPRIKGFTTNPTLMRKAGISDYRAFARSVLDAITAHPVSFEVFSDEFPEMERQALEIASWGKNVYVKIPVTNTKRQSSVELVRALAAKGVKQNVTAVFTHEQVREMAAALKGGPPSVISVFAGRIADSGRDPKPHMAEALKICRAASADIELLWASPREVFNVAEAESVGCDIITATPDLLKKLAFFGKDLGDFSLETVEMFYRDAKAAGYRL